MEAKYTAGFKGAKNRIKEKAYVLLTVVENYVLKRTALNKQKEEGSVIDTSICIHLHKQTLET